MEHCLLMWRAEPVQKQILLTELSVMIRDVNIIIHRVNVYIAKNNQLISGACLAF